MITPSCFLSSGELPRTWHWVTGSFILFSIFGKLLRDISVPWRLCIANQRRLNIPRSCGLASCSYYDDSMTLTVDGQRSTGAGELVMIRRRSGVIST